MTAVLVDLVVNLPDGTTGPAKGTIWATPIARGRDGTHVIIAAPVAQVLVAGTTTFVLKPGTYRFREDIPAGGGIVQNLVVPDSADGVNYGDLVKA